jgi:hypothetical protein
LEKLPERKLKKLLKQKWQILQLLIWMLQCEQSLAVLEAWA